MYKSLQLILPHLALWADETAVCWADACTAVAADCLYFSVFAPATTNASALSSVSLERQGLLGWDDVKDRTHSVPCTLLYSSVSSSFFGLRSYK